MKILSISILSVFLLVTGCATNPVTGDRDFAIVSEPEEIKQGQRYHQQIIAQYGIYDDPDLQQYVDRIGQELARKSHRSHLKYTFTVLDSPEINAFALPGGYIYITRGIMAYLDSEAELAGVLGHEIGHVTARHSVRQQSGQFASTLLSVLITATTGNESLGNLGQQLGAGLVRGYGRKHELEADRLGAVYLHNTGYDPESMLEVIGVLKDQEVYEKALAQKENRPANIYHGVFSTHPRNDDRLKTVVRAAKKLSLQDYRESNRKLYQDKIDGMVWGPSVSQGVVSNNRFSHPELAFAIQLPAGWKVTNNPEFLAATSPDSNATVQIGVTSRNQDESLTGLIRRLTKNKKLKVKRQKYGATATTKVKPRGAELQPARISAIELDSAQVLTLIGTSKADVFGATDLELRKINQSFTRLSPHQIDAIITPRIRVIAADSRDSFNSLAQQSAIEHEAESILRLLNRAFPAGKLTANDRIKTVILDE